MFDSHDAGPSALHASKVSPKEEAFCLAIVSGANASDAYRTAYRPQRAKAKTIHEKASRLMAKGKVQARVAELMAPVIADAQMSRLEWLELLTRCCRFDPRKMFDTKGTLKAITEFDENEAAAIAGFEVCGQRQGTRSGKRVEEMIRVKLTSRLDALALVGKACHWYADQQEHLGSDGGPVQKSIVVSFVRPSISSEEAYHGLMNGS